MSTAELIERGEAIWGRWGWQTRLAEELGIRAGTVRKYKAGSLPIPRHLSAFLRERHARLTSTGMRPDRALRGRMFRRGDELVIRLDGDPAALGATLDPRAIEIEPSGTSLLIRRTD